MALVLKDRVKTTTTTAGTGTITLGAAASGGYQAFSVIGDGSTTYYVIQDSTNSAWEVGLGTYTSSGTTLSRDTILESSSGGSAVDFAAGTKDVFISLPAERAVYANGVQAVSDTGVIYTNLGTVSSNTTLINNGATTGPVTISNSISLTVPDGQRLVIL